MHRRNVLRNEWILNISRFLFGLLGFSCAVIIGVISEVFVISRFDQMSFSIPVGQNVSISLHETLTHEQVGRLAEWIEGRSVRSISISNAGLDDSDVELIAAAIRTNRAVERVDLSQNQIRDRGAIAIASAVSPGTLLCLQHNQIGAEGGLALIRASNQVKLYNNRIGDEGARLIAAELARDSRNIQYLNLTNNGITIEGDRLLAATLPRHIQVAYRTKWETGREYFSNQGMMNCCCFTFCTPLWLLLNICPVRIFESNIDGLVTPRTA